MKADTFDFGLHSQLLCTIIIEFQQAQARKQRTIKNPKIDPLCLSGDPIQSMRVKLTLDLRRRAKAKVTPTCKLSNFIAQTVDPKTRHNILYNFQKLQRFHDHIQYSKYQRHTIYYDHNRFPLQFTKFLLLAASSINQ